MALVEPAPESYREKGRFTPPDQPKRANSMEKAWAYPAIAEGRLYVRDRGTLWCSCRQNKPRSSLHSPERGDGCAMLLLTLALENGILCSARFF